MPAAAAVARDRGCAASSSGGVGSSGAKKWRAPKKKSAVKQKMIPAGFEPMARARRCARGQPSEVAVIHDSHRVIHWNFARGYLRVQGSATDALPLRHRTIKMHASRHIICGVRTRAASSEIFGDMNIHHWH